MYLIIDIVFDLNKFYKITNTTFPSEYIEKDYLMELLKEPGYYLSRYVDDKCRGKFNYEYNGKIKKFMNKINSALPMGVRFLKFEEFTDEEVDVIKDKTSGLNFYKQWRDDKEPIEFDINNWIPKVDISKL
jgi:hypothetical protein